MKLITPSLWMLSLLGLSLTVITCCSGQPQHVLVSGTPTDTTHLGLVSQSSGFEVPDDIGLPNRREPGGTR